MATYNSGQVKFGTPGAVIDSTIPSRRLYDFSDRVAELSPEESPFFVYLSKVGKVPTSDSQFRFLEDRTKISIADRSFLSTGGATLVAEGSDMDLVFDTTGGAAVSWLIPGMIVAVSLNATASGTTPSFGTVRINTVAQGSASTTCGVTSVSTVGGSTMTIADNAQCTVVGTSFQEGSGAPDVWSQELENGYGYTQIFKTAAEITNTAYATRMRGYANEFERVLALKLREHKIDIERAMLFNHKARSNGINYTEGIVGQVIKNSTFVSGTTDLSYTSGKAYARSMTQAQLTYDRLLSDLEVIFDPARGGSNEKLVMASLPIVTIFNKLGDGAFIDASVGYSNSPYRVNMNNAEGAFGHKVMEINTVHGDLFMVKQPLFRGHSAGLMLMADMSQLYYRPLVGNGVNRDTQVQTNVQAADEDLRKDVILTEAGLEVCLPEAHALFNVEGV